MVFRDSAFVDVSSLALGRHYVWIRSYYPGSATSLPELFTWCASDSNTCVYQPNAIWTRAIPDGGGRFSGQDAIQVTAEQIAKSKNSTNFIRRKI